MKYGVIGALLVALAPSVAQAGEYVCDGTVSNLSLNPDGLVVVSVGSLSNVYLCKLSAGYNNVSAETCKGIYAHLLGAKLLNKTERFQFNDSLNCTNHPSWMPLTWTYGPTYQ